MIVNSQPYNPSQQSQQQRCVGLEPNSAAAASSGSTLSSASIATTMSRLMPSISNGSSQQNSLYGSTFVPQSSSSSSAATANHHHNQSQAINAQSHMHDLMANLQTHNNVFGADSTYDLTNHQISLGANMNNQQQQQSKQMMNDFVRKQQQQQSANNDVSLYSPSSSTSLLYHIYDQINLPNEPSSQHNQYHHVQTQQQGVSSNNLMANASKKQNTTILNPANLFSQPQNNLPLPVPMQMHQHQHQHQQLAEFQQNYAAHYSMQQQHQQQQQQPFSTLHHSQSSYMTTGGVGNQQNLMLDTLMRQQRNNHHQQRPLSSSGTSSMSGQSTGVITYGRQPRTGPTATASAAIASATMKSQNLATALQSNNTLGHHHLGAAGPSAAKLSLFVGGSPWKRLGQRARHFSREYSTFVKCLIFLIISAFTLMSIIKFTLPPSSVSKTQVVSSNLVTYPQHPSFSSNSNLFPQQNLNLNLNNKLDLNGPTQQQATDVMINNADDAQQPVQQQSQEMLKSKLLTCKFVILNQNYSHSAAQRRDLAERIVKLMDQVFLATDVRRVYLKMDVTSIRPNRPSGIVVDCNIVLSESIAAAAQQFGLALYESLVRSHERLANNQNYIVDKSSIAFNTVPDKDLKSGIVPPEFTRLINQVAPSTADPITPNEPVSSLRTPIVEPRQQVDFGGDAQSANINNINAVVWTEWSAWSSCINKNGVCDEARIHSRLRECVSQHTGERVNATLCKERFNPQDLNIEVDNCARTCKLQQEQQVGQQHQFNQQADAQAMSDAPSSVVSGPQTAPSVMVGGNEPPATFPLSFPQLLLNKPPTSTVTSNGNNIKETSSSTATSNLQMMDLFTMNSATASPVQAPTQSVNSISSTTERITNDISSPAAPTMLPPPPLAPQPELYNPQQQQPISCSNCTSDEVCLLLMQAKVPFCAKIKDRSDESGCGGWCKAQSQLCQPVGHQAFKCIHESECLPDEFRCHDSVCIPLSKRCDGHANCYDSSDERDCPIPTR